MSYAFNKCIEAQTAFDTAEELHIKFLVSLISTIISPFRASFSKFNLTDIEQSHLNDLFNVIDELSTFHSKSYHSHGRNHHPHPTHPSSPTLHAEILVVYGPMPFIYNKCFDLAVSSLSRLSSMISRQPSIRKYIVTRCVDVLSIKANNKPYTSFAEILRDILDHGYSQSNRLQIIASFKSLRNGKEAKAFRENMRINLENTFMKSWKEIHRAKFDLLDIDLTLTQTNNHISIYDDTRRLKVWFEVDIANLFGLNKKSEDGILYVFNDMVLICSKKHNTLKICYSLYDDEWCMDREENDDCGILFKHKGQTKMCARMNKSEMCSAAYDTIQQYYYQSLLKEQNGNKTNTPSHLCESQLQTACHLRSEASTKDTGSRYSTTYSALTENTAFNLSEPPFSIQHTPSTYQYTPSTYQYTPLIQSDNDDGDVTAVETKLQHTEQGRQQFEVYRSMSLQQGRRSSVPSMLSSISSSGNANIADNDHDHRSDESNGNIKRSKSVGVRLNTKQVRFKNNNSINSNHNQDIADNIKMMNIEEDDHDNGDDEGIDDASVLMLHDIPIYDEDMIVNDEIEGLEKELKERIEIAPTDLYREETPSIDGRQFEDDPYGVLDLDIDDYTEEDDCQFKMKLLFQPKWASNNEIHENEPFQVREYPQLQREQFIATHLEVLDNVTYGHNMHIHKQKMAKKLETMKNTNEKMKQEIIEHHNNNDVARHPFERFLDEMHEYEQNRRDDIMDPNQSRELYYLDDNDHDEHPPKSDVSSLGPSPSILFDNERWDNEGEDNEGGDNNKDNVNDNEWVVMSPTQHLLDRFNLQTNNGLLLAEIQRLRCIIKEQNEDMEQVDTCTEALEAAKKEIIRLKTENDHFKKIIQREGSSAVSNQSTPQYHMRLRERTTCDIKTKQKEMDHLHSVKHKLHGLMLQSVSSDASPSSQSVHTIKCPQLNAMESDASECNKNTSNVDHDNVSMSIRTEQTPITQSPDHHNVGNSAVDLEDTKDILIHMNDNVDDISSECMPFVDELDSILSQNIENLNLAYRQFAAFKHQFLSKYSNGMITCPNSDHNNNNSTGNKTFRNNGNNGNSNNHNNPNHPTHNINNSGDNEESKQYGNGDGNDDTHSVDHIQSHCNHLTECHDCYHILTQKHEQIKLFKLLVMTLQKQHEYHSSFEDMLCKALASANNTTLKRKSVKKMTDVSGNKPRYDPRYRAKGNFKISKQLTETVIPNDTKQHIYNVYWYLNKSIAMQYNDTPCMDKDDNKMLDDKYKILNCDLNHKFSNEPLYLYAERSAVDCKYIIHDKLYTTKELSSFTLPQSSRTKLKHSAMYHNDSFIFDEQEAGNITKKCKWKNIPIFNTKNNKQRLTLSITQEQLNPLVAKSLLNIDHGKQCLIPILMFNDNSHWVEYVLIVHIQPGIDIGISLKCTKKRRSTQLMITGIHLDKDKIFEQHQLYLPHKCECLSPDKFTSIIHDIHVGNPDDVLNQMKCYKQKYDSFKQLILKFINGKDTERYDILQQHAQMVIANDNGTLSEHLFSLNALETPSNTNSISSVSLASVSSSNEYSNGSLNSSL